MADLGPMVLSGGTWRIVVHEAAEVVALGLDHHELGCEVCASGAACAAAAALVNALRHLGRIESDLRDTSAPVAAVA